MDFEHKCVKYSSESQYSIDKLLSFIRNELKERVKPNHLINSFDSRTKQYPPDLLSEMTHKRNKFTGNISNVKIAEIIIFFNAFDHLSENCNKYSVEERKKLKSEECCFRCVRSHHFIKDYTEKTKCRKFGKSKKEISDTHDAFFARVTSKEIFSLKQLQEREKNIESFQVAEIEVENKILQETIDSEFPL